MIHLQGSAMCREEEWSPVVKLSHTLQETLSSRLFCFHCFQVKPRWELTPFFKDHENPILEMPHWVFLEFIWDGVILPLRSALFLDIHLLNFFFISSQSLKHLQQHFSSSTREWGTAWCGPWSADRAERVTRPRVQEGRQDVGIAVELKTLLCRQIAIFLIPMLPNKQWICCCCF